MSLQKKASLFGGIGLLILLTLVTFLGVRALEESSQRTFNERVVTAQMVAQGIDQSLRKAIGDLQQFATMDAIDLGDSNLSPAKQALEDLYRFSGSFTFVFLLNEKGELLYAQPNSSLAIRAPLSGYQAVAKAFQTGNPQISSTALPGFSQGPVFTLAVPVKSPGKGLSGVVGGLVDLSEKGISSLMQPIRLGETAYAEVVNAEGVAMATTKRGNSGGRPEETEYAAHFVTLIKAGKATNETCYRCHEAQGQIQRRKDILAFAPLNVAPAIGGVAIRQLEAEALAPTRKLERDMLLVGIPFFLAGVGLIWLGTRGLVRPIVQLTTASQRIAQGNLDTALVLSRKDELGKLAHTFDQMRQKLRELLKERDERARESESRAQHFSALNSIAATVSQSLELDRVLEASLDKALATMHLGIGGVFLKEASGEMQLKAHRGASPHLVETIARLKPELAFTTVLAPFDTGAAIEQGLHAFIHVPLLSKGKLLGSMILASPTPRQFTPQEMELLTAIGHQIGTGIDNAQLFQEAQRREKESEALFWIGMEIARLLDIDKILDSVVNKTCQLLEVDTAILSLLDQPSGEIYVRATSGPLSPAFKELRLKMGQGLAGRVISLGQLVATEDYLSDTSLIHTPDGDVLVREAGLKAHLAIPLTIGERVFGCLSIANRRSQRFSEWEIHLLRQLAHLAAVAIENARLYSQVQDIAILQERDRIAREMHDGLGQVLGYLALQARSVEDLLAAGKNEAGLDGIKEIRKVTRDAYEDARQGILALRSHEAPEAGLLSMLEEFVEGFRQQTGIPLELKVADSCATQFPSRVAVQLARVIQEALVNVRKHARAKKAEVRFEVQEKDVLITIEDDGIGFDPTQRDWHDRRHFGLQTMRERAESVGGQFAIDSQPGRGTRVRVRLPLGLKGEQ